MGQNSSENMESRHQLALSWIPLDREPNIFTHKLTHEQIQRHYIRILIKDLPRQTALFSNRINNHQPYVCRLLYFHPAHPDLKTLHEHQKDFREMFIYTDRFLPLKQWNRDRIILALHGLRRLVGGYGPFRITDHMVCQNQYGEIKVWISQNPVNNHPDFKYPSEEQSMGDFAALLTRKNQELASYLIGCNTLKEAYQRLSQPQRDHSPHHNYSHRASGSGDISKKKSEIKQKNLLTPYKNVFGDINQSVKMNIQPTTPKSRFKMFQNYPQSSFLPKEDETTVQTTNSATLSRYREFAYTNKSGTPNQQKMVNKSNPKNPQINSDTYIEAKRREEQHEVKLKSSKGENVSDGNKGKYFLSFTGSNVKSQQSKPFVFQHRFETATNLSPNLNTYNSPKGRGDPVWSSNDSSNLNISTTTTFNNERAKGNVNFKQQRKKVNGYDITIINNNINNYINNITHNHILKVQKSPNQHTHHFRTKNPDQPNLHSVHSSNQFSKNPQKAKDKQFNIPVFIQQKKKSSHQFEDPIIVKSKSNNTISRKFTVSSNPQINETQIGSDKKMQQSFDFTQKQRKQQKAFNFSKNNDAAGSHKAMPISQFNASFYPLTPTPSSGQNFSSFQKAYNNSLEFKVPLRTKTTQFYQKVKDIGKKDELQNKSFTQTQLEKSIYQVKSEQKESEVPKQIVNILPNSNDKNDKNAQKDQQQPRPQEKKLQFNKKQLRNEFSFLLGGQGGGQIDDAKKKQQQNRMNNPVQQKKQVKQGNLKDKIMRKQIVFAQLKKQAFQLLQ